MDHVFDDFLEFEAGEPGCEHILTDTGLEASTHAIPQFALAFGRIGRAHDRFFAFGFFRRGSGIGLCPIIPSGYCLSRHLVPRFSRSVRPAKRGRWSCS
ncbi:hypothetical protein D9M68_801900 [compost metagenome]